MKKIFKILMMILMLMVMCCLISCEEEKVETDLWENATYKEDTEFGNGSEKIYVEVSAEDKSVTFTINTDKEMLGDALTEHQLISGEQGAYGLYVKSVNGIKADYDEDGYYWALNINGESSMTGVDGTKVSDGEHYELVRTDGM